MDSVTIRNVNIMSLSNVIFHENNLFVAQNPGHTCCKFEAEEAKRKQEEEKQKQIEEIKEESSNESVEGQGEVKQEKVETVISEVPVQSLETVSNPTPAPATRPTIQRKTIDNAPISAITQNDVEKQQLEGKYFD